MADADGPAVQGLVRWGHLYKEATMHQEPPSPGTAQPNPPPGTPTPEDPRQREPIHDPPVHEEHDEVRNRS